MNIDIGISKSNLKQIGEILNKVLANEYVLYTKTLNYHWNVQDRQFHDLHVFLRHQYEALFEIIDDVAERATTMGSMAFGTLKEFSKNTDLEENPGNRPNAMNMLAILLADHETIIKQIREYLEVLTELDDAGTNNFLTDIMERHEKAAWMIRSHLVK